MRMLVFFDLPSVTNEEKKEYRHFRKMLIENGFYMLQESVYCKLLLNGSSERSVAEIVRRNRPPHGYVQMLTVTEKQFAKMEYIVGESKSDVIDSDERLVIL